jgi:hypothetical protein
MTTDDPTRPPGLRGQTCPNDGSHPAHVWISHLVNADGERVWCLGQPAEPALLDGIAAVRAARARRADAHPEGSAGYDVPLALTCALRDAADIAATLEYHLRAFTPERLEARVGLDPTDDGKDLRPYVMFTVDNSDGAFRSGTVAAAAADLRLAVVNDAPPIPEWTGSIGGVEVFLTLCLPDPDLDPTWRVRLLRRLPYRASGVAVLAATAAAGVVVALAARHALTRRPS